MTDRELLELAAKAAGIKLFPIQISNFTKRDDDIFIGYMTKPAQWGRGWFNPLEDDGDALRLAVKIGLDFYEGDDDGRAAYVGYYERRENTKPPRFMIERHDAHADPYAATRRAIVRAAAEIGASA